MAGELNREAKKIVLNWWVAAFLPIPPDTNDVQIIHETLYPEEFESDFGKKHYWSVPEHLIDIRWAMELQGGGDKEEHNRQTSWRARYGELEYLLYRMVTTLGEWCGSCRKSIDNIQKNGNATIEPLEQTWLENEGFFRELASRRGDLEADVYTWEELNRIGQLAKELSSLQIPDDRKGNLKTSAKQLYDLIVKNYGEIGNQMSLLNTATHDDMRTIHAEMIAFSEKVVDFFNNFLWRKNSPADQKLRKLEEGIQKVVPEWEPKRENELYFESMWEGLQFVADKVCDIINGSKDKQIATADELLQRVKDAMDLLGIGVKKKTEFMESYLGDQGRCLALLELKNGLRFLSFSGFLDCEDSQTQRVLACHVDAGLIDVFRKIAQHFDATLVTHSPEVVDGMARCEVGKSCSLIRCGPMRAELQALSDGNHVKFIKKSYSCCERKIIAKLNARGGVQNTSAVLLVKYEPCLKCYGILRNWADQNRIQLALDYPQKCGSSIA